MKTLTLKTETLPTKDDRRAAYGVRHQDHGTRGTKRDVDYYGRPAAAIQEADLEHQAQLDILDHLSSQQLEKMADSILRHSGMVSLTLQPETGSLADTDYEPTLAYNSETIDALHGAYDVPDDELVEIADIDVAGLQMTRATDLEAEIRGLRQAGSLRQRDADAIYEGAQINDHGDYLDGFTITERP